MKISQKCVDLVKHFEGFYSEAYFCPAGKPTIGYGTTGYVDGQKIVVGKTVITPKKAAEILTKDLDAIAKRVDLVIPNGLINQDQFDALVSWVYNLGLGSFLKSTLLKKIRAGAIFEASAEFIRWNKAKVRGTLTVLPGLTRRRQAEAHLFLTGQLRFDFD